MFDVDLLGLAITERSAGSADGYVEICGRLDATSGWLVGGWAARGWDEQTSGAVSLRLAGQSVAGSATTCFFNRDDLDDGAVGFVMLLRSSAAAAGRLADPAGTDGPLLEMTVDLAGSALTLMPASAALPLAESELRSEAARLAGRLVSERARVQLGNWLNRPGFTGADTLAAAGAAVRLELEAVLPAPPADLVLIGWLDDPAASIAALQIRCGDRLCEFDATTWVRLPRRDVQAELAADAEDFRLDRGFLAYFPGIRTPGVPVYIQIEFTDGTAAYRPVPPPGRAGLAAMQLVLGAFHLRQQALAQAMGQVIGPAVAALNAGWLSQRPRVQDRSFGPPPATVRCSVIIRLCDRADELEWQLALLSEAGHADVEFLFVLDDPNLRDSVEQRCETCFARFGVPFRLLLLDRFVGQAPCDNIAAAHARGALLCFLSPAAIPDDAGWLDRLLETLEQPAPPR